MGCKMAPNLSAEMDKIQTKTKYPCTKCNRLTADGTCKSNNNQCFAWSTWFGEAWRLVTERLKREDNP